jgi:hypothetical protein
VRDHLQAVNTEVLRNLDLDELHPAAVALSGSKMLLESVLSLGMPYTLERDDILHGFFRGTEPLMDQDTARQLLSHELDAIQTPPYVPTLLLNQVAILRYARFAERLQSRLNELAEPEIPRMIGHTLRLLRLLEDAHLGGPANSPPPALEVERETNALRLILHGEPYAHYSLHYSDNLNPPVWTPATITNFLELQLITLPVSGLNRFYQAVLPMP